jgi:phage FluMu gp28-like protein
MTAKPTLHLTERCQFLVDNLNLPAASGIEDAKWEHFQLAHLNDDSIFRIENKSRQIAWSFLSAMEGVADAILTKRDSIYSSINHDEAREKIRYAKQIYECLEISGKPRIVIDNQLELEFSNGARLTSFPARPVRGKPKSNWFGDEFAHIQRDRLIYKGSLPIISKGGRIRIGSSPLGASGMFWEIFTESLQKYPGYSRKVTPWWQVQAFCLNVREAAKLAPKMSTFERVEMFGKDRIKAIFANLPLEDFQQEYEAVFVDESTAWITWAEIQNNQNPELVCLNANANADNISECLQKIDELRTLIESGTVEGQFGFGADIGRTRNASEFFLVGLDNLQNYPLRLMLTLNNCSFETQETVLTKLFKRLPIVGGEIDRNGLGMQLAENMAKEFPFKIRGMNFTNESKKLMATDLKMLFQKRKIPIPVDRDLAYQIHSVKKIISASKNLIFDTDRNEKHHADKFWALGLAISAARREWFADDDEPVGSYVFIP